jgi:hypothetical protein
MGRSASEAKVTRPEQFTLPQLSAINGLQGERDLAGLVFLYSNPHTRPVCPKEISLGWKEMVISGLHAESAELRGKKERSSKAACLA